jgi:hypothetical protein
VTRKSPAEWENSFIGWAFFKGHLQKTQHPSMRPNGKKQLAKTARQKSINELQEKSQSVKTKSQSVNTKSRSMNTKSQSMNTKSQSMNIKSQSMSIQHIWTRCLPPTLRYLNLLFWCSDEFIKNWLISDSSLRLWRQTQIRLCGKRHLGFQGGAVITASYQESHTAHLWGHLQVVRP